MEPKFTPDFPEPFRKMLRRFAVFVNGSKPSKLGVELSWTRIVQEDRDEITSIPKFGHYSKKGNLRVFDRLPSS
jgi:hypothetical protein